MRVTVQTLSSARQKTHFFREPVLPRLVISGLIINTGAIFSCRRIKNDNNFGNYSAALYLRLLNSHLIGFLALAKERVRLLPFGWHPGTQLLGAHLNSY
ncbi:MAG: hypothetical protein KZQ60_16170 [Candidatus Thiodiazotropha sp. (ex Lucinoma aequizonata)]|nr:hypothetical protein [Candidatus Thiodiazotropha sp. (ex Lucinoma aequizonata)]